jgi:protein TonB
VFDTLIESKKTTRYGGGSAAGVISIIFHSAVITGAVYATLHAGEVRRAVVRAFDITQMAQAKKEPPPPPKTEIATVAPPPKGFQTLAIPTNIPINIPPPSQNTSFNAADFSGIGVEGGIARGVVGGTGPVIRTDQPYLESVVEERPDRISGPVPRYPEILRQAGIDGRVLLEFVVDTTGHVERGSLKVLSSTNQLFNQPAIEAVAASLYRPGRIAGRAVRVRVQQPLNFQISRSGLGTP